MQRTHKRLRFAHARGARIQIFCPFHRAWETIGHRGQAEPEDQEPSWGADNLYRVHAEDAALEYGQISTALRSRAINPRPGFVYDAEEAALELFFDWLIDSDGDGDDFDVLMFELFVAEAMADEGL
jgi:hypothetical protein